MTIPTLEGVTQELRDRVKKLRQRRLSYMPAEIANTEGFNLDPGWAVKTDWMEDQPKFTYISPDKWEFTDFTYGEGDTLTDYTAISPEGKRYTRAELEPEAWQEGKFMPQEDVSLPFPTAKPIPLESAEPFRSPEDELLKRVYPEMFEVTKPESYEALAEQGKEIADINKQVATGQITRQAAEVRLAEIEKQGKALGMGTSWGYKEEELPAMALQNITAWAARDPDAFLEDIRERGDTADTRAVLKMFGGDEVTEDVISGFFAGAPPPAPEQSTNFRQYLTAALPNITKPSTVEWAAEFFKKNPDELRAELITAGRNEATEALVRWKYPAITNQGLKDYFSEDVPKVAAMGVEATVMDAAKEFVEGLTRVPKQLMASILQGIGEPSVVDKDWASRIIKEASTDIEKAAQEVSEKYRESDFPIKMTDLAQLPQNLAYSAATMGGGLTAAALFSWTGPGAAVALFTASGAIAYRMTKYQIMQQYLEEANKNMLAERGSGITKQEEDLLKDDLESKARAYGLWEAVPEAISNLLMAGIVGGAFTKTLTKVVGGSLAARILGKVTALYGEELLTETITQKGQSDIEVEAGLREGRISWVEAFKEIAPQTFLLTTIMGGAGQISVSAYNKAKASLKQEIGQSHPLYKAIEGRINEILEQARTEPERGAIGRPEEAFKKGDRVLVTPQGETKPIPATVELSYFSPFFNKMGYEVTLDDGRKLTSGYTIQKLEGGISKEATIPSTAKPINLGTGSSESDALLARYRKIKKSGRSMTASEEKALAIYEAQAKADPSKWKIGDGIGWKVANQTNRGFRVIEINTETKMAKIRSVADTGLTITGGADRISDQWVHVADLVRDNKYNAPLPKPSAVTPEIKPTPAIAKEPWMMTREEFNKENTLYHYGYEEIEAFRSKAGTSGDIPGYFSTVPSRKLKDKFGDIVTRAKVVINKPLNLSQYTTNIPGKGHTIKEWLEIFKRHKIKVDEFNFDNELLNLESKNDDIFYWSFLDYDKGIVGEDNNILSVIKKSGYDGIISKEEGVPVRVPFDASQIITHKSAIQKALSEGKPVPASVLKDYPELVKPAAVEGAALDKQLRVFETTLKATEESYRYGIDVTKATEAEYVKAGLKELKEDIKDIGFTLDVKSVTQTLRDEYKALKLAVTPGITPAIAKEPWMMSWDEIKVARKQEGVILPGQVAKGEQKYVATRKVFEEQRTIETKRIKAINNRINRLNPTGDIENVDSASKRIITNLEAERDALVTKHRSEPIPYRQQFIDAEVGESNLPPSQKLHIEGIQQALREGKLSVADYNRLHAEVYGPIEQFMPELVKPAAVEGAATITPEEIQWRFPTADDFYFWARKNNLSEQQSNQLWNAAKEAKKTLQGKKPSIAVKPTAISEVAGITPDIESKLADIQGILDEGAKAKSIIKLEKELSALDRATIEGLEDVESAIADYKDIQKAGISPEDYQSEKESAFEEIQNALDALTVAEEEVAPGVAGITPEPITPAPKIEQPPESLYPEAQRLLEEAAAGVPPSIPPTPPITEAPPPGEGATRRVFDRIQTDYAETGFIDKVRRGWNAFNIHMFDDLFPLKKISDQLQKGGVELSIQENPYLLARLLRGVTSKATSFLEQGTFGKEFWKMEKGKAVPNYTGESLDAILQNVKDPVVWRDFSTYLTARRAVELSQRGIETGIEVNDATASISELEGKYANFPDLAKRVYKYQDSLLVYANESGLISGELLGKLRKYGNYVPFYRVFNELEAKGTMGKKMANIASPIKRIKGSEREIINPLESIVKNTYVLVSAADRNQVGIALANIVDKNPELADVFERVKTPISKVATVTASELGVDIEGLSEGENEQVVDIFRPSFFVSGNEVTVLIDGKKQFYKVDADLRDAMLHLNRETLGMIGKILGAPARWLRAGATLSPDFMFRNPARDQLTAFAYSNYGYMPGIDFVRGIASMLKKDSDYQLFRMSGAEHSMLVSIDRSYLQKTFKEIVEGKGFTEYVKHPMELFRIISELGEKATRLGEFRKGIKSGAMPLEAGYSARAVTLDFAQAGTTAQAVNTLIAFFNANIRGSGRLISSLKEHPIRTSAKIFGGITLPSILLYLVNRDDERWKEIPQWQKDVFWIVFAKGLPANWKTMTPREKSEYINNINIWETGIYRIPKPFEVGILFGSVPERFLEWLDNRDPELLKDVAESLVESGNPGFIPTAGLPIIEWITNYSFFRRTSLVPKSREAMPPELQYTPWTSEVSKHLGELLKLPPAKIDNLFFGWTGGLGRYAVDIADGILKGTGISPDIPEPSPTLADKPVIKAFVVRNPYGSAGEAVNDFYNKLEKYEAGEKYLKEMMVNDELEKFNTFKAAHPELFFFADFDSDRYKEAIEKGETPKDVFYSSSARYLRRVASELSELRKKQDLIYKDTSMTPEKKRKLIDEIDFLKTDIARKALNLLEGEQPPLIKNSIDTAVGRLGEVIEEVNPLSLEKPSIYDMRKLNQVFPSLIEGATTEELKAIEDIDPIALAWKEKNDIEKTIEPILATKIKDIAFNLKEGVSFDTYYNQWKLGFVPDSPLDKIPRQDAELLKKFYTLDEAAQKKFVKDNLSLSINPKTEWLRSHPKENAQLAIWGQAKILTKEAYNEFKKLLKELDIPDNAIPEQTLPPKTSIDTHFRREELLAEGREDSPEAELLLLKDFLAAQEAGVESYVEWHELKVSDKPLEYWQMRVDNQESYDKLKAISEDDTLDKEAKAKASAEVRATKVGDETFADIERRVDAMNLGTREVPVPPEIVNAHVEYMKKIDVEGVGPNSAEVILSKIDQTGKTPSLNAYGQWRLANELDKDLPDFTRIPIYNIEVQFADEYAEHKAIGVKYDKVSDAAVNAMAAPAGINAESWRLKTPGEKRETLVKEDRARFAKDNNEWRITNWKKIGYEMGLSPTTAEGKWVKFNELPLYGSWRDRYKIEDYDFFKEVTDRQKALNPKDPKAAWDYPTDVKPLAFDNIRYGKHKPTFERYFAADEEGKKQIFAEQPVFEEAFYRYDGYDKLYPENMINAYVNARLREPLTDVDGGNTFALKRLLTANTALLFEALDRGGLGIDIERKGQPDIVLTYLELKTGNERIKFRKEHPELNQYLVKAMKFHLVPSEYIEKLYAIYEKTPEGKRREDMRAKNRELDAWLVLTGKVSKPIAEVYRERGLSQQEKFRETLIPDKSKPESDLDKAMAELAKNVAAARKALKK